MRSALSLALVAGVALVAAPLAGAAMPADRAAAAHGAAWLARHSTGAPGGQQADSIVALRLAGRSRASLAPRLDELSKAAPSYAVTAAGSGKVVMALVAGGRNPTRFAGIDYIRRITGRYATGRYGETAFDQAYSILALRSAGRRVPAAAIRATLAARARGGWGFAMSRTAADSVDATSLMIEALRSAGVPSRNPALRAAAAWMLAQRNAAGGLASAGRRRPTEANSTAGAIRALRALGRTPPPRPAPPSGACSSGTAHSASHAPTRAASCWPPTTRSSPSRESSSRGTSRLPAVSRLTFQAEIDHFRSGLVEMASLVLSQVERAVVAWEEVDASAAADVIAADDQVDQRCAELDQKVFSLQLLQAPVAGDQRLLHVGLIAVIALERVGDLAVAIAEAATSVPPEGAVPEIQALIARMSARAVNTLARAIQAIARGDAELGEQAAVEAATVRQMLAEVVTGVAGAPDEPETRIWAAAAVLVARHLERVANNGAELGGRVRFLVSGEAFTRDS